VLQMFGATSREWIDSMIRAVIEGSVAAGRVAMSEDKLEVMSLLRDFMFEKVYLRPESEAQKQQSIVVIRDLVDHFVSQPGEVPDSYTIDGASPVERAIDYVAGMTDRFAIRTHDALYRPTLFD